MKECCLELNEGISDICVPTVDYVLPVFLQTCFVEALFEQYRSKLDAKLIYYKPPA